MGQVTVSKVMTGHLGPGETQTFFQDDVSQTSVRTFTAVPIKVPQIVEGERPEWEGVPLGSEGDIERDNDQFIEISRVFHILKGAIHTKNGTGGTGTVQVNFSVHNLDQVNPADFAVFMAEMT
jgi:hypothetical protein